MLLIKAKGGLGNRMLTAASAILYAEATGRSWYLDWHDGIYANRGVNAYPLLFKDQQNLSFNSSRHEFKSVVPALWQNNLECSPSQLMSKYFHKDHSNPLAYRKMSAPLCAEFEDTELEVFWSYTSKFGRVKSFLPSDLRNRDEALGSIFRRHFQPCEQVQRQVDALQSRAEGETILGVHIRYTDLKVPIQKVLTRVTNCMASGQYTSLFLATDSERAQNLFESEFENVLISDKQFSEHNQQLHSLHESETKLDTSYSALVDMLMLARCSALVYCSRSTFSECSRLLGEFSEQQLFDLDRFDPRVRVKRYLQEFL